ncbi:hypothetical protein [Paraburkholderia dipogonis]|uniref:hypothetical protein n=1 Tax=Paraburkholderia dipogonis TaxID=1211383 RepID=UPI0038BB6DEC
MKDDDIAQSQRFRLRRRSRCFETRRRELHASKQELAVVTVEHDPAYVCHASDEYAPSYIASSTGFPEITVNAGRATGNVPVGVSFLGRVNDDEKLLSLACSFESSK